MRGELGDITCIRFHQFTGRIVATTMAGHIHCFQLTAGMGLDVVWSSFLGKKKRAMTLEFSDETRSDPDVWVFTLQKKL
jgi:hypothetical protein